MPWKARTVKMSREMFVAEVIAGEKSKSRLCREYGISRVTGDKWLKRFGTGEGLDDRSRAPFRMPNKTPQEQETKVLETRASHPAWGPRKIRQFLINKGETVPGKSTISNILKRNGCVSKEASQAATPYKRFQREHCNEMWQTDFKGHFAMKDGNRCHPLTVLDDCSRYSLCVDAKENEQRAGVTESFERLFEQYGLPDSLLCDNGNPWGASQSTGYTQFEIWLMDRNILPIHGRIRHPQTQGKEERFHRTMDVELLQRVEIKNMGHAQRCFDEFRRCYNHERPHEALGMGVPFNFYHKSPRRPPQRIEPWEYAGDCMLRRVKSTGYVTFMGQGYFLSEAFGGLDVAVRESSLDGCFNVLYRGFRVARINVRERALVSKRIFRKNVPEPTAPACRPARN